MNNNYLKIKSYDFAIKLVKEYKGFSKNIPIVLSTQILKSGTSIGANISEANGTQTKPDFISKLSIAYKETVETKYWLNLLKDSDYLAIDIYTKLYSLADEIAKLLYSSIKTAKNSKE